MYVFQQQLPLLRVELQPRLHDLLNMFNIVHSIFMGHLSLPLAPMYMARARVIVSVAIVHGSGFAWTAWMLVVCGCLLQVPCSNLWVLVASVKGRLHVDV